MAMPNSDEKHGFFRSDVARKVAVRLRESPANLILVLRTGGCPLRTFLLEAFLFQKADSPGQARYCLILVGLYGSAYYLQRVAHYPIQPIDYERKKSDV